MHSEKLGSTMTVPAFAKTFGMVALACCFCCVANCDDPNGDDPDRSVQPNDIAARIVDQILGDELEFSKHKDQLAGIADDETFIRRVTMDVSGRLPEPDEIIRFIENNNSDKRKNLVRKLLANDRFGINWGRYWRDVILYRRSEDRGLVASIPTETYLANAFNENLPWDKIASDMITAEGEIRENGAGGLFVAHLGKPEETASEISRVFMGIQIQCAQCHDHPYEDWTREQFHQLAAFLPRVAVRPIRDDTRSFQVVSADRFPRRPRVNANNRYVGTAEHYMSDLDNPKAKGKLMAPAFFVAGQSLEVGAKDSQRRKKLAEFVTDPRNPWFAGAFVNRVWAELVGEPFYASVEDLGPGRKLKAEKTYQFLRDQFIASDYDVKWLFRTILMTDAYQREAQPRRSRDDVPFMANRVQRLRSDQLLDAFQHTVGKLNQNRSRRNRQNPGMSRAQNENRIRVGFNERFGYDPSVDRDDVGGSIAKSLAMMNSPAIDRAIKASIRNGKLNQVVTNTRDVDKVVEDLYLLIVARKPSSKEKATSVAYVKKSERPIEGVEDLVWALLNSAEFMHRN